MSRISTGKRIRRRVADDDYPNRPNDHPGDHPDNGEESYYEDSNGKLNYIANFNKGLLHHLTGQEIGEVIPNDYRKLLKAIKTGRQSDFNAIPRGTTDACGRKFVNPQAGLAFDLEGLDSHALVIKEAPRIRNAEAASEMAEAYWMAYCRDVSFNKFDIDPDIGLAVADLSLTPPNQYHGYTKYTGPPPVTRQTIFRGTLPGDSIGPYVSQFLFLGNSLLPIGRTELDGLIQFGTLGIDQRQVTVKPRDYMTKFEDVNKAESWLYVQNGFEPRGTASGGACNYSPTCGQDIRPLAGDGRGFFIRNMRDLANYVHIDDLPQSFINACLILKHLGVPTKHGPACAPQPHDPVNPGNPYVEPNPSSTNQEAIATFGDQYIITLVTEVTTRALKAAWFQKWFVHRRLRPEEFGGRIDATLNNRVINDYEIDDEILRVNAPLPDRTVLDRIKDRFGSYLLPQAYPEGSPIHPSYPSGHATIAGACVTILKAHFDEDFDIPNPVMLDPALDGTPDEGTRLVGYPGILKVGDELNKLASNISIGRNMAGVHYRSDYLQGVLLGEKVAISILEDQANTYNEDFSIGFTKFNGKTKIIRN